jgi:SAM-dependent methyltransferase
MVAYAHGAAPCGRRRIATMSDDDFRARLYRSYASEHAGVSDRALDRRAFDRDIRPHLPEDRLVPIADLGCGQGELVRQMTLHGYSRALGIDVSPEQIALARRAGIEAVQLGDFRKILKGASFGAVTATDFFEHLTKREALEAADSAFEALTTSGVLIVRVPNMVSPFGGYYRYGDLTHETSYTPQSLRQLGAAAGFSRVECFPCPPLTYSLKSYARAGMWRVVAAGMKFSLGSENGSFRDHIVTQNVVAVMHK